MNKLTENIENTLDEEKILSAAVNSINFTFLLRSSSVIINRNNLRKLVFYFQNVPTNNIFYFYLFV